MKELIKNDNLVVIMVEWRGGSGGGGFTQPISGDGGADQLRGVPIIGRLPTDGTRGPEVRGYGRIWPDAEGLVQAVKHEM